MNNCDNNRVFTRLRIETLQSQLNGLEQAYNNRVFTRLRIETFTINKYPNFWLG